MKSLLIKSVIVGLLSAIAMSSVFADMQCRVHNARGQFWLITAPTRSGAVAQAMRLCARNSVYAANCVVDWCNPVAPPAPPVSQWQCNAGNARGQVFVGLGPTRAIATANVMGYCAAHSAYARNCTLQRCFRR